LFLREGWQLQFLEEDLLTPLRKKLVFQDPAKITQLAERGRALRDSESKALLEYGLERGRGGFYLTLDEEQYQRAGGPPKFLMLHDDMIVRAPFKTGCVLSGRPRTPHLPLIAKAR
ncbi:MAG TPA: hypothetical protein VHD85_09530, partial [Terracidiphilus sp.]|nr:hypothetical protein [Terracidiphilus sp.]